MLPLFSLSGTAYWIAVSLSFLVVIPGLVIAGLYIADRRRHFVTKE